MQQGGWGGAQSCLSYACCRQGDQGRVGGHSHVLHMHAAGRGGARGSGSGGGNTVTSFICMQQGGGGAQDQGEGRRQCVEPVADIHIGKSTSPPPAPKTCTSHPGWLRSKARSKLSSLFEPGGTAAVRHYQPLRKQAGRQAGKAVRVWVVVVSLKSRYLSCYQSCTNHAISHIVTHQSCLSHAISHASVMYQSCYQSH